MWRPCIKRAASACLSRGQTRLYSTQYEYGCTGSGLGARATVSFVTGHEVKTDLPSKLGGKDEHPQPVELVLAGLIGCEVSTASFVARHMVPRFPLGSIAFDYRASRDGSAPVSLPLDRAPSLARDPHGDWHGDGDRGTFGWRRDSGSGGRAQKAHRGSVSGPQDASGRGRQVRNGMEAGNGFRAFWMN